MLNSIISLCIFLNHNDTVYVLKTTKRDNKFPIKMNTFGGKLEDLELSGQEKNDIVDLVYDTLKLSLLRREIMLGGTKYLVFSTRLSNILENMPLNNIDLKSYPESETVICYFIDSSYQEESMKESIKEVLEEINFSIYDILKIVGIKNIAISLILISMVNFFINEKIIKNTWKYIQEEIIQLLIE